MGDDGRGAGGGLHRSLNLSLAAVGAVVLGLTAFHLVTSVDPARLAGALAIVLLGWLLVLRIWRRTS